MSEKEKYIPSPNGCDCPRNGQNDDIECGCDECDYYLYCFRDKCSDIINIKTIDKSE